MQYAWLSPRVQAITVSESTSIFFRSVMRSSNVKAVSSVAFFSLGWFDDSAFCFRCKNMLTWHLVRMISIWWRDDCLLSFTSYTRPTRWRSHENFSYSLSLCTVDCCFIRKLMKDFTLIAKRRHEIPSMDDIMRSRIDVSEPARVKRLFSWIGLWCSTVRHSLVNIVRSYWSFHHEWSHLHDMGAGEFCHASVFLQWNLVVQWRSVEQFVGPALLAS